MLEAVAGDYLARDPAMDGTALVITGG